MTDASVPTPYDWAGGEAAWTRLTAVFYRRVRTDDVLAPVFADMPHDHPAHVATWFAEVFGGPDRYTSERGGYEHMVAKHIDLGLTETQRARWVQLMLECGDEAGLPADAEFRSALAAYVEWGTRLALVNSQPGADPPLRAPVPKWSWGEAPPYSP